VNDAAELIEAGPADVARLLRARTKDADGRELGEWTDATRPTLEEVEAQIEIARAIIATEAGEIPEACAEGAETVVALLAAMLVEQSYFPEQVSTGNLSAYAMLERLFQAARAGLHACVEAHGPGAGGVYCMDVSGDPPLAWPEDLWQRNLRELAP
jgi:hypothetical protein